MTSVCTTRVRITTSLRRTGLHIVDVAGISDDAVSSIAGGAFEQFIPSATEVGEFSENSLGQRTVSD
jgi:hypothetical protein